MKAEEFIKEVMHRAGLSSRERAQDAVRAMLETLSEHLTAGEVGNFVSQLPPEIVLYMQQPFVGGIAERFSLDEFVTRVSEREGVGIPDALLHARVVAAVLREAVSPGQLEHMLSQIPPDIAQIFHVQNEGGLPGIQ